MEGEQWSQQKPEEADDALAESASAGGTEQAADGDEEKPAGGVLAIALMVSMLGLQFLKRLVTKPAMEKRRPAIAAQPCPCEEAKQTAPTTPELESETLEIDTDAEVARRRKWGTPLVLLAFAVGMAGGVGFMFLYWTGSGNRLLGGTLALCLGGFGAVLVLYAQWMMRRELVVAPREQMPSSGDEREGALQVYSSGVRDVQRRSLLKWMGAGAGAIFAAITFSLLRSLARVHPAEALFTTVWKRGERLMTTGGKALTVDSLHVGSSMIVFPETSIGSEQTQTVLIRVDPRLLQLPKDRSNWAPMGYVAYSRVCTHAGCAVGMFEAHSNLLLCPCHQSTFDVLRGAVPTGGPAARPLPQLPLYVDKNGNLCAQGGFSSPPGPGFTGMPS